MRIAVQERPGTVAVGSRRARRLGLGLATLLTVGMAAAPARAVTTLSIDLSTRLGPVTHAAGGSLYGVLETQPADVMGLIAPLRPKVLNNPAADVQQPVGDALVVAQRVAPTGTAVSIRLADWLTGFYTFTTMADWFNKIGQTVSRKQAGGLTNIYGYEVWNEPNGTWASSNPLPFNQFWMQTVAKLRTLDPGAKLIGPSISFLDMNYMQGFLSFCQTNACLPDIVSWHELDGANLTGDIQTYRALEERLGIGPLPISINEYSGAGHINVEGQPGASAPLIAKFERFRVESACISFWDVGHPGRLGSLLATDTTPNGGWWFYKWYGDMSGDMVATTPPTPNSATALDGFANVDGAGRSASVLFGGTSDGTVQLVVTGFRTASFLGSTVHAVVEHTPFVNRTTPVTATDTLSTADVVISGDQISITVAGINATDGYRLVLTPAGGDGGSGGSDADGGREDAGSASEADGGAARGDAAVNAGGAPVPGGDAGPGRDAAGSSGGGTPGPEGGATGGSDDASRGAGGVSDSGGAAGSAGGEPSSNEASTAGSSDGVRPPGPGGCSCRAAEPAGGARVPASVGLLLLLRRRRRDAES